ncbi:hypothetical protein PVK06_048146 [Gossypium arboreum]|uniref:Uncharacterized protein n=1 Tax=Gossypium arboreum TaxID=29729 RepID=A0ABR0MF55_GOSAR|nr:hypothetical protein PVK06_048146 [Gossypium arboreum]
MERIRGLTKKANSPTEEHASSATAVHEKAFVPREDEEIMENKGPFNEASIKRMTRGIETPILKEAGTSKTKKGKAKVDSKRTTLYIETYLWHKMKVVEKMVTSISNRPRLIVASLLIMQVSDNDKDEESKDIEECLCKIDSLFEEVVEAKVGAKEEKVVETEKEKVEEDFVEKVVIELGSVGANIDNLEQIGVRPVEVAEVTSKGKCNPWAIVVYTRPPQVASHT